jgi:hypothetical protein
MRQKIYIVILSFFLFFIIATYFKFDFIVAPRREFSVYIEGNCDCKNITVERKCHQYALRYRFHEIFSFKKNQRVILPEKKIKVSIGDFIIGYIKEFYNYRINASYSTVNFIRVFACNKDSELFAGGEEMVIGDLKIKCD